MSPPSAFRLPPSGISLIEILISMGILAIGLLGVAALFPVGGHYLRQGDVSDRADAIAQAAFSDAAARGLLDPERWLAARWGAAGAPQVSVYDREFAPFMRTALAQRGARLSSPDQAIRRQAIREMNLLMGSVFVVDPLGVAGAMNPSFAPTSGLLAGSIGYVPAATEPTAQFTENINAGAVGWWPWLGPANGVTYPDGAGNIPLINGWPVRRLSVSTGALPITRRPVAPMLAQAQAMVTADDDLSIQLDDYSGNPYEANPDNPSQQPWAAAGGGRLARLSRGDFTWCMTVVPKTPDARDALARDPESFYYDVSAVVFYKRAIGGEFTGPTSPGFRGHDLIIPSERVVRAVVGTPGVGGGQLRVVADAGELAAARDAESPLEKLRGGQWVMLLGPHPDSTSTRPLLFCQWYKVVSVENDPAADASVFVHGPDWPWTPRTDGSIQTDGGIQNDLRMIIMPDVVAVHTRTMKLSPGSAWGID